VPVRRGAPIPIGIIHGRAEKTGDIRKAQNDGAVESPRINIWGREKGETCAPGGKKHEKQGQKLVITISSEAEEKS